MSKLKRPTTRLVNDTMEYKVELIFDKEDLVVKVNEKIIARFNPSDVWDCTIEWIASVDIDEDFFDIGLNRRQLQAHIARALSGVASDIVEGRLKS